VKIVDEMLEIIQSFAPDTLLKYNKFYIGLAQDGQPTNFCLFKPRKKDLNLEIKLPNTEDAQKMIEKEGLDDMGYDKRGGVFRIRLSKQDIKSKKEVLKSLMIMAYNTYK
jgi:hypothetical protein